MTSRITGIGGFRATVLERWWTRFGPHHRRARHGIVAQGGDFDGIDTFCLFIGHPRSGHTLVGALLNAHPSIVISHELDVLRYVDAGYSRDELYWSILERDRRFVSVGARWLEFDYAVPGLAQGTYTNLRIIGDKKGGATTRRLARRPWLLDQLRHTVGVPLKLVLVTRNPFDNIATIAARTGWEIRKAVDFYFSLAATVDRVVAETAAGDVRCVPLEVLVANPAEQVGQLCSWLGAAPSEDYLEACAAATFDAPRRSRTGVDWSATASEITERARSFPWLHASLDD